MFRACEKSDLRRRSTDEILYEITGLAGGPFSQKNAEVYAEPVYACASGVFYDNSAYDYGWFIGKSGNTFRNFAPWLPDLSLINSFSFGLISIFMAFLIPYTIMESKKLQKQKMITGFASVSALIALANPQYVDGNLVINSGYVGTGGMTVAMVMGLVIGWLFSAYFKHGLFKKNSSLPSVVVVWFESILIIFVLILVCIIIGQNVDLFSLLEKVFSPLAANRKYLSGIPAFLYDYGIVLLLWTLGVDGLAHRMCVVSD